MFDLDAKDLRRFWAKVCEGSPKECWPWIGKAKHWKGYGLFKIATGKPGGQNYAASRIACFLAHGPSPEGKPNALHSCDNPICCNPSHLRWGNQTENVRDAMQRLRHKNPPKHFGPRQARVHGENVGTSKLKEAEVRRIWGLHLAGWNTSEIAADVNRTTSAVYDICRGRSWRHLEGAPSIEALKAGGVRRGFNQFSR